MFIFYILHLFYRNPNIKDHQNPIHPFSRANRCTSVLKIKVSRDKLRVVVVVIVVFYNPCLPVAIIVAILSIKSGIPACLELTTPNFLARASNFFASITFSRAGAQMLSMVASDQGSKYLVALRASPTRARSSI